MNHAEKTEAILLPESLGVLKFWQFFEEEAAPKLARRERTFRKMFEYLDGFDRPVFILETGCAREAGNWGGDGQSTVLFDRYISARDERSVCHSVDISADSIAACQELVSERVKLHQSGSVAFLKKIVGEMLAKGVTIDCLYLDSFDLDWNNWYPSAAHHLKELCAAMRCIRNDTLVVVDDCPFFANMVPREGNKPDYVTGPSIGGKGRLVAEFAQSWGAKLEFAEYQAGWTGF